MSEKEIDFRKILPPGKERAVSMERLAQICGVTERQIRQMIFDARCSGLVIASGPTGYYLPVRASELKEYISIQEKRCRAGFATLPAAKKKLEQMQTDPDFEQMKLEFDS
jgi:biotin operon repressor